MDFVPIAGRLTYVGDATASVAKHADRPNANWVYSSLIFREEGTDRDLKVENCKVSGSLNRHLEPGETGVFLIARSGRERMLAGFRNDRYEEINAWVNNPQGTVSIPLSAFFTGLLLTVFVITAIIGIPLMIYAIYAFFKAQAMPGKIKRALKEHGFSLRTEKVL